MKHTFASRVLQQIRLRRLLKLQQRLVEIHDSSIAIGDGEEADRQFTRIRAVGDAISSTVPPAPKRAERASSGGDRW